MERAERSGGLHKRSAEAWGDSLCARGAELPLAGFRAGHCGAGTGPAKVEGGECNAVEMTEETPFANALRKEQSEGSFINCSASGAIEWDKPQG